MFLVLETRPTHLHVCSKSTREELSGDGGNAVKMYGNIRVRSRIDPSRKLSKVMPSYNFTDIHMQHRLGTHVHVYRWNGLYQHADDHEEVPSHGSTAGHSLQQR